MGLKMIFADKKFRPLFWTQFLGSLNDNFLKNALVVMITFKGITVAGLGSASVVAISSGLFILPFFLFSPLAGQVADKLNKDHLVRLTKIWEVFIMLLAGLGFYFENFIVLLGVLFLAGIQATLFGPVKYSLLPDLVETQELVEANAYVELGTFLAILLGTIGGGIVVSLPGGPFWIMSFLFVISILGLVTGYQVPKVKAACPKLKITINPIPAFKESLRLLKEAKAIFNSVLGISWLWFFGAAILTTLPIYCKDFLGAGEQVVTCFLAMFTLGTGIGSIVCEKLSFKRIEIGLVPIGSLGMTIFLVDLFFVRPTWPVDPSHLLSLREFMAQSNSFRLMADFFLMSAFGGVFVLPLYTLIQDRSHAESRSRVIAGNNIFNALFMVVSSLSIILFHAFEMSYPKIFLTLGLLNFLVALYIYSIVPEFTLRFLSWVMARALYRLECIGEENIPKSGPAVLVCNHASFADWLIISALVRRPIRFVMYYKFFNIPILNYLMRQAKVIPIAGAKEDAKILAEAYESISSELRNGEIVCIFPEGKITRDGEMAVFRSGVERILERDPVPVIPMALKGLWDSLFGFGGGKPLQKLPRRWLSRIQLVISSSVQPKQTNAQMLSEKVKQLLNTDHISNKIL